MSNIKQSHTRPEITIKEALRGLYFRYQPNVYGKPDFARKKEKMAIFVDGCFWHGCPKCYTEPKSNKKFWRGKIKKNINRDLKVTKKLKSLKWRVIRIWGHEVKENPHKFRLKIESILNG